MKVHVQCMQGIGDTLYARPFIGLLSHRHEVYVETVLPDLLSDLPVKFVKPTSTLRTQSLQLQTTDVKFVDLPAVDCVVNWRYDSKNIMEAGTILHAIEKKFPEYDGPVPAETVRRWMNLPPLPPTYLPKVSKPIAVLRPVTTRLEFPAPARSPEPSYIGWCGRTLKNAGYHVVSIADCDGKNEILEHEPTADWSFHKGELGILGALSLISQAKVVITGSGFALPAAIAAKTNLFVIFGGRGGYDSPQRLFDLRMDMGKIGWSLPDNFCRCKALSHDCDKSISALDNDFYSFMGRIA